MQVPSVPQPKSNPAMLIPAYVVWLVEVGTSEVPAAPVAWAAALLATAEDPATATGVWTAAEVAVGTEPEYIDDRVAAVAAVSALLSVDFLTQGIL